MAYLSHTTWKDRPGAVAAVVAIHGLVGYALVTGLSFEKIIETVKNPQGINVEVPLDPPPPPPEPDPQVEPEPSLVTPPVHAPAPPLDLSPVRPPIDTTPIIVPLPDPVPFVVPRPTPSATPARPAFDPVAVRPRGDPGKWVTVEDYRSSWISREWTGVTRFRLTVGANGKVQDCAVTASSGHAELDNATCALISRRAQFEPARDATGTKIAGSYASAVRWELPE
ncbi:TonB family protein [Tsuneonella sp. YG55]|uniref:TonB family protein n=1 Tax=Tsuneonella litorea TaxID=2976475 RepID=A0A9X3AKM0_9SPHN|nr:TonB family protein [Tsuneonella litorea]MCT2558574.1 TonB family protein [Tsuneonella litorea]